MSCGGARISSDTSTTQEDELDDDDLDSRLYSSSEEMANEVSNNYGKYECTFDSIKVLFPYDPYQSQKQMMQKIISGVQTQSNCLLESPTGTGKTAAILCSLLAWQKDYESQQKLDNSSTCQCQHSILTSSDSSLTSGPDVRARPWPLPTTQSRGDTPCPVNAASSVTPYPVSANGDVKPYPGGNGDVKPYPGGNGDVKPYPGGNGDVKPYPGGNGDVKPYPGGNGDVKPYPGGNGDVKPNPLGGNGDVKPYPVSANGGVTPHPADSASTPKKRSVEIPAVSHPHSHLTEMCESCKLKSDIKKQKILPEDDGNIPTIYYTTRTHSQIKQVVQQLKHSAYSETNMTVLSSRNMTCINDNVKANSGKVSIDDECQTRRQNFYKMKKKQEQGISNTEPPESNRICEFYATRDQIQHAYYKELNSKAFDIEDLLTVGVNHGLCPYYGSKYLKPTAKIIFCPYNYILYPWIQQASEIEIQNNIIVFDEAHNIEQICRDASSIEIKEETLRDRILFKISAIQEDWKMKGKSVDVKLDQLLNKYSFRFGELLSWIQKTGKGISLSRDKDSGYRELTLDKIIEDFGAMGFGRDNITEHRDNVKYFRDPETSPKIPDEIIAFIDRFCWILNLVHNQEEMDIPDFAAILSKKIIGPPIGRLENANCEFKLMCNNPALVFRKFQTARSVIIASGTLSPISSFESELGIKFENQLSAGHVIRSNQIWAGSFPMEVPNLNLPFELNKKNQDLHEIQDFIGEKILRICEIVPCGVVVFLPSYTLRNLLRKRWELYPVGDPLLGRLSKLKNIYYEESSLNPIDFKEMMADFRRNVTKRGCILFAVFRGKISEGIDFKDDEARCVISVGIPHLPVYSAEVIVKMKYNNQKCNKDPQYLSGRSWYECQAFRALNQGLGRCIRHKDDWGALVLLDGRFSQRWNSVKISKWVRDYLESYKSPSLLEQSLEKFMAGKENGE